MRHGRKSFGALVLVGILLGGCAHPAPAPSAPIVTVPAAATFQEQPVDGAPGQRVTLPHYLIYSTIDDRPLLGRMGQLMEGALAAYRSIAPEVPLRGGPMDCYIFRNRAQWAAFTKTHTGEDAAIYLRVNRGGYTVGDWFVAYWIGDPGTFSVAAHEGWHQYVARNLNGRLPPFLEEGLACLFEQVEWVSDLPRWDLSRNQPRLLALRTAVDSDQMYPLSQLVRMHAGQVVGRSSGKIEAFYAESWAFARFLIDGDGGKYRPALNRMLADAAHGTLHGDGGRELSHGPFWNPATARPMLEHYLGMNLSQIEAAFARYVRQTVDDSRRHESA